MNQVGRGIFAAVLVFTFLSLHACGSSSQTSPDDEIEDIPDGEPCSPSYDKTIEVPGDYRTIQEAIDEAADGDLVLVQPGIYVENIDFLGKAITVQSVAGDLLTVIESEYSSPSSIGDSVVTFESGETKKTVLDGFTICMGRGKLVDAVGEIYYLAGGGIYCSDSSPTIKNCTIWLNRIYLWTKSDDWGYSSDGGGIYIGNGSAPTILDCMILDNEAMYGGGISGGGSSTWIVNCTIKGNQVDDDGYWGVGAYGGGVYGSPTLVDCTISENSGRKGGGIYGRTPTLVNCRISDNSGGDGGGVYCSGPASISDCSIQGNTGMYGGGIYCSYSETSVVKCTISGNSATLRGGGIYCRESAASIMKCTITENSADRGGGGVCFDISSLTTITNCVITGNCADQGGGVYSHDSDSTIRHCTISGNIADAGGGISCEYGAPIIMNCILWGDHASGGPEIFTSWGASPAVTYSDIQGGWAGEGNIDADPHFVSSKNYHLSLFSPCIDAGTDVCGHEDIDGQSRPWGAGFDMGADEFSLEPSCSTIAATGNQFLIFYLIPALALIFFSRRFLRLFSRQVSFDFSLKIWYK